MDTEKDRSLITCVCLLVYRDEDKNVVEVERKLKQIVCERKDLVSIVVSLIEGKELKDAIKNTTWTDISADVLLHIVAYVFGVSIYVLRSFRDNVYWEYCPPLLCVEHGQEDVPTYITLTEDSDIWYPVYSKDRYCGPPTSLGFTGVLEKILKGLD